jgi:hypothetical protein
VNGLADLFYADRRAFVNDWRRVKRSPARIALWSGYALVLALVFWTRTIGRTHATGGADLVRADFIICMLLAALALGIASGRGAVGIFRSRAEARLIIGSPVAAPLAIAYFQVRESLATSMRLLLSFLYFIFAFGPRHLAPLGVVADIILVFAILAAAIAISMPRRLLRPPAALVCACAGGLLTVLVALPALRDALLFSPVTLGPWLPRVLAILPAWHPGRALLEPSLPWILAAVGTAAAAIAVLASAGRDAYPELYALSVARIDRREHVRRRFAGTSATPLTAARRPGQRTLPAPPGVLVFVWKSVVEFSRSHRAPVMLGGCVLWCVAGFAAARVEVGQPDLFATFVVGVVNVILLFGLGTTSAIALEVRRPLFWLSGTPLFERLGALLLGRIWRIVLTLELAALGFALGGGSLLETLVFAVTLPAGIALLAGVGLAAYAFFPATADMRGPVIVLRLIASLLVLAPPATLFGIAASLGAPGLGLVGATLVVFVEAGALVGIAAWRLDGRVDRLPA